jgi:hypothetical protein
MALPTNLTTNEVKNAAGTEIEFTRIGFDPQGRLQFKASSEAPNRPHRITVAHREVGEGVKKRRESVIQLRLEVDDGGAVPITDHVIAQITVRAPIGIAPDAGNWTAALAELGSFVFTTGTNTFLYDGTGTGAAALIAGTL